ncbi:MAG: phosphoglycerate dehydrogenase [Pirellulaceae bacterium]|nr:phosphoglycerate dehydrogenase [Pirellulaceae bacterium]
MPTVLVIPEYLQNQPSAAVDTLKKAGFEIRFPRDPQLGRGRAEESALIEELAGIHATLASGEYYTPAVIEKAADLRVIARVGVGYDRVALENATDRKIVVTITPNANHESVAEMAIALMLAAAKSIVANDRLVRGGGWNRAVLIPLRSRTLGIFGLGRIGKSLAIRAKALGMDVIATEMYPDTSFVAEHGIELVSFDELVTRADFLSVHCPLTEETKGLFDAKVFAQMKPSAIFINTARGPLVVEADLCEALQSKQIAAAGIDVFEQEPPDQDNPLFEQENVILCPHLAGVDELSTQAMASEAAECIARLSQGVWPSDSVVNRELESGWTW